MRHGGLLRLHRFEEKCSPAWMARPQNPQRSRAGDLVERYELDHPWLGYVAKAGQLNRA